MSYPPDPLKNVADVIMKHLATNTLVSEYEFQEWDSDEQVQAPRGYVNVSFDAALISAGGPVTAVVEIILEGKPKQDRLSSVMGELFGMVTDPMLHVKLNQFSMAPPLGQAAANIVQFYRQAERLHIEQRVEGDERIRRTRFDIQILPLA